MLRIALIPGDGIGMEVVPQARRALEAAAGTAGLDVQLTEWDLGAERWLWDGVAVTEAELEGFARDHDAILLGALGDPRVPGGEHARGILRELRSRLDLYVNFHSCVLLAPELCPLKRFKVPVRLEIFRESSEGAHGGTGVERVVRAAFGFARARGRSRVTLVDDTDAVRGAGDLWPRVFDEVGSEHPEIEREAVHVDAVVRDLVRRPERFAVLVTSNLFRDVEGDLAAELTGGLGLAPSADIHPGRHALFAPVHGPEPEIAGMGRANPFGVVRSGALPCCWTTSGTRRRGRAWSGPWRRPSPRGRPRPIWEVASPRRSWGSGSPSAWPATPPTRTERDPDRGAGHG